MHAESKNTSALRLTWLLLAAIMLVAVFFRFYRLTELPPGLHGDEAMDALKAAEVLRTGDVSAFYEIKSLAEMFPGDDSGPADALSEEFLSSAHARFMHETFGSEGLFATLTAVASATFGNAPWVIRSVAALFGVLTILGLFFLSRALFGICRGTGDGRANTIDLAALVAAYFLAVSFWHVNFSRMGFRSILMPLFTAFAFYFLIKALWRTDRFRDFAAAGAFLGLGFHTYIAYRVVPLAVVLAFALKLLESKGDQRRGLFRGAMVVFAFAVIFALPLIYHYALNPQDFLYRMATMSSGMEGKGDFALSAFFDTLGQFNVRGDGNLRHNHAAAPHLLWPVGIFFLVGVCASIVKTGAFFKNLFSGGAKTPELSMHVFLVAFLFVSLAPSFLSAGPHPHAIRSFNAILPALMLATNGALIVYGFLTSKTKSIAGRRAVAALALAVLASIGAFEYKKYFSDWAKEPELGLVFHEPHVKISAFINSLPREYKKFVVVNFRPETVMHLTDSYDEAGRKAKNIVYLMPKRRVDVDFSRESPYVVIPLDYDSALMEGLTRNVPGRLVKAEGFEYVASE